MDLRDRRDLYNGFGNGLSRAFEIAVTPVVFGFLGWVLDQWIGITPALTLVFLLFALAGTFVRMWYGYDAEMKTHDVGAPWNREGSRT